MSAVSLITSTTPPPSFPLSEMDTTLSSSQSTGSSASQNVDAVSTDFEAVFLTQMMEHMFSGDSLNAFFGGGTAGEVYKGYLVNEYGKMIAKAGGIGIAFHVKQELLKLQEIKP